MMDPWQPLRCSSGDNDVAASASVTLPPVFPQFVQRKAMDSAQYLSIIEAKLERIKGTGCSKDPAPKDIIKGLDQIRTAQLHAVSTGPDSNLPYLRNSVVDVESSSSIKDTVLRKIAPEKQTLNEEELRSLLENDELHDKTVELYSTQQLASAELHVTSNT